MGRALTGKISTGRRIDTRPNGDKYVYERQVAYDPQTKKTKTVKLTLLGKIPAGSTEMIPTRPRNAKKEVEEKPVAEVTKTRVGMTQILEWVGCESGIDADLASSFDAGDADKVRSIARYWIGTDGQTLPRLESWQLTHKLPYASGISEDVYQRLFASLGRNEAGIQSYFRRRADRLEGKHLEAYDSTTVSTYSAGLKEARQGFNKDRDGLDTIKLLTLYSVKSREPIAFAKQPGNIPDVVAVDNALTQLECFAMTKPTIVTDNGYYSEANLREYVLRNKKFLTLGKTSIKWLRECIDEVAGEIDGMDHVCPTDPNISGMTRTVMHKFSTQRQRNWGEHKAGETETFERRLYVHIFKNLTGTGEADLRMRTHLQTLQRQLLEGATEFTPSAQEDIDRFLVLSRAGRGGRLKVSFNNEAYIEAKRYNGYFILVSNEKMDTFEALASYRLREKIEELFAVLKGSMDGRRPRVWSSDSLNGRLFAQFIGLGYYSFLTKKIKELKESLGKADGLTKGELEAEENLRKWLESHSLIQILDWFDCVERTDVGDKHWTTEQIARDRLFLSKLGIC